MSKKFKKDDQDPLFNPIDWFNFFGDFKSIFSQDKSALIISDNEIQTESDSITKDNNPTFKCSGQVVNVLKSNKYGLAVGAKISKFMLLTAVKFKGDSSAAASHVNYDLMKSEIPYIRVGTDYYKRIYKVDRWGAKNEMLKPWTKEEIKQDHTKDLLKMIYKFDDFTIIPDNKNFIPVKENCYNVYSKFPHESYQGDVSYNDIPTSMLLLNHIFGDQFQLGLKYMKVLYEHPQQIMPILSLVSTERETGKTTFLNWINMIFADNCIIIYPSELVGNFNSIYATKNIVMVDETVIEKGPAVERLKSITTAKTISVSQKYVQNYSIPFYGKIIMCTNKEVDFIKIDDEEIRFWVRKINPITGQRNTKIEQDLFNEIPKFLKYLEQLPDIDFTRSRMVFTQDEISTNQLTIIKEESKSQLRKDIEIHVENIFLNNDFDEFEATAGDIKERFYDKNNQVGVSYIRTVLKDQMKLPILKVKKYYPFSKRDGLNMSTGAPFLFLRGEIEKYDPNATNVKKSQTIDIDIDSINYDESPF